MSQAVTHTVLHMWQYLEKYARETLLPATTNKKWLWFIAIAATAMALRKTCTCSNFQHRYKFHIVWFRYCRSHFCNKNIYTVVLWALSNLADRRLHCLISCSGKTTWCFLRFVHTACREAPHFIRCEKLQCHQRFRRLFRWTITAAAYRAWCRGVITWCRKSTDSRLQRV